jgi:hypothetical protein
MEITVLKESLQDLFLLASPGQPTLNKAGGYLLGRKMNQTFFVEKIYVLPWKELFNPKTFFNVEKSQRLEILGVFSFDPSTSKKKNLQHPLFCEKVFLALKPDRRGEIKAKAQLVQFDRRFSFVPLDRIILELEEEND